MGIESCYNLAGMLLARPDFLLLSGHLSPSLPPLSWEKDVTEWKESMTYNGQVRPALRIRGTGALGRKYWDTEPGLEPSSTGSEGAKPLGSATVTQGSSRSFLSCESRPRAPLPFRKKASSPVPIVCPQFETQLHSVLSASV